eukprot:2485823-Amphidinium_carterae.2
MDSLSDVCETVQFGARSCCSGIQPQLSDNCTFLKHYTRPSLALVWKQGYVLGSQNCCSVQIMITSMVED